MNQSSPTNLNLCTDPWLPVQDQSGQLRLVSLIQLFEQAEELRDLVLQPQERIAVMRLLICITQRAINGPADLEELEGCRDRIVPAVIPYLRQWSHAFDLVGENGAFLQFADLEPSSEKRENQDPTKLNFDCACGNNSTLFDNEGGAPRERSLPQLAVDLVTYQNFAPGGTTSRLMWGGIERPRSAKTAPCGIASAIHTFIIADNILSSIHLNLVPTNSQNLKLGIPVWEKMPQDLNDASAIENATRTLLGRLVPVSRCIRICLTPTKQMCWYAQGLDYGNDSGLLNYFEPSCCILLDDKQNRKILSAKLTEALWRNLNLLLLYNKSINLYNQPASLSSECLPKQFSLWAGALVADPVKPARILGNMEEYYAELMRTHVQNAHIDAIANLLTLADKACNRLKQALKEYNNLAKEPSSRKSKPKGKNSDTKKPANNAKAEELYWGKMAAIKSELVRLASQWIHSGDPIPHSDFLWFKQILSSARFAFQYLAPKATIRQLHAYMRASQKLPTYESLKQWIK